MILALATAVAMNCTPYATDGDTFRCGGEIVRVLGIDAPEMPGHCREGRVCVEGDPYYAKAKLNEVLERGSLRIVRFGKDYYGRTLGAVRARRMDISCFQLRARAAAYVRKWDNKLTIQGRCPRNVRDALKP